ncbi:MAG TPA: hypothetical protein VJS12_17745 [Steroidobacteraceae bacterium]|nr:hypothetical protein [Steroidobacteraceae bacterium]
MSPSTALRIVKIVHTVAWAFFVVCIVAIPFATYAGNFFLSFVLIAIVLVEVAILVVNRWRCPLTDVAARYTADRHDNFDIFLPLLLARHNKLIFGSLFVVALAYTLFSWMAL